MWNNYKLSSGDLQMAVYDDVHQPKLALLSHAQ